MERSRAREGRRALHGYSVRDLLLLRPLLPPGRRPARRRRRDVRPRRTVRRGGPARQRLGLPVPPREVVRRREDAPGELPGPGGVVSGAGADRLALWPSIDLKEGRVVRLLRGELSETTVYEADPQDAAQRFEREGADGIHVVDLDAAFGRGENRKKIGEIVAAVSIPVQVGGGF